MNRLLLCTGTVLGLAVGGAAQASGAFTGRVGLDAGSYKTKSTYTDLGCCGSPGTSFTTDDSSGIYGLLAGAGATNDQLFADVAIEFSKFSKQRSGSSIYRSDGLFTLGMFLGDRWAAFAGFRHATYGTGFFSDTQGTSEDGPFLGGSVSFQPAPKVSLGSSLAYNILKLKVNGKTVDNVDYNGLSAKVQANFLGTPHSVFLRWQRFHGDLSQAGNAAYEQTDNYFNLGYQATFDFKSW